ncbi:MAG: leucyl/phenylalanyl-tRNA--protein transferase [Gammaproteobacteria bacterium]|nr:leucyl/phenylalanyl-tRNA--protein transferase [Gammaproteobacteria bacterium]
MAIKWLDPVDSGSLFPPVEEALKEPDGLLAAGGDLSPNRLLRAYRKGIFPWYEEGQPILWWSPNPRAVLHPQHLRISRSLRKTLRNKPWTISFDQAFERTVSACAAPRRGSSGTWITDRMLEAYCELFIQGHAHSVEVWDSDSILIGGLYGVGIGKVFFGESMFSHESDSSKVALIYLLRHLQTWGYPLIDCQLSSPHIDSLGAEPMPRNQFIKHLNDHCDLPGHPSPWTVNTRLNVNDWLPSLGVCPRINQPTAD